MDVTDGMKEHIYDEVTHRLSGFPRIEDVHIILELEREHRQKAEVVIQGKNHIRIAATAETTDMYASIDGSLKKAEKQLRRERDKVQDHHNHDRRGLGEIEAGI